MGVPSGVNISSCMALHALLTALSLLLNPVLPVSKPQGSSMAFGHEAFRQLTSHSLPTPCVLAKRSNMTTALR